MKRVQVPAEQTSKSMRMEDIPRPYCYRFLAPTPLCSSLMGPKGKIIQEIQNETVTFIKFSDHGDCYPNSSARTGTVLGSNVESLSSTIKTIMGHLVECSKNLVPPGDPDIAVGENVVFAMVVPRPLRGVIIGPGGAQVTELRKMSNTKIRIDDGMPSDSVVRIEGPAEGVCAVALWINEKLDAIVHEPYFSTWAKGSQQPIGSPQTAYDEKWHNTRGNAGPRARSQEQPYQYPQHHYRQQYIDIDEKANWPRSPENVRDILNKVAQNVYGDNETHLMKVPIPMLFKGALIGKGGNVVREIMHDSMCTGLSILEDDEEHCTVHIEGSIMSCTAAYLLVMNKYVAHERYILRRQHLSQNGQ